MTAAFVKHIGSFSNKTSGTTLAGTWTSSSSAGNVIVAYLIFDNAATTLKPTVTGISVPAGETASWVFLGAARTTNATLGASGSGELWAIKTTVNWTTPVITATLSNAVTQKAMGFSEYVGVLTATPRNTVGTAYSTSTAAASSSTTGTAPQVGDLAVGLIFTANIATVPAGDNDTTAGAWSTPQGVGSTGGGAATNNYGGHQYKVLTAATHQTLNNQANLLASNGSIVAILQNDPDYVPPPVPKTETVVDSFDTEISTVTWPTGLRYGTVAWDAGRAAISERAGDYSGITTETIYDFNNSYVYCQITPVPIMTGSTEITLGVRDDANTNGMFFIAYNDAGVTPTVCMRLRTASVNNNFFAAYDATVNPWVRMRKDASNVYWDVSPDGTTWTNLKTLATALSLNPVMVELSVGQWGTEATQGVGYFDNVNFVEPTGFTVAKQDTLGVTDSQTDVIGLARSETLGLTDTFDGTKTSAGAYATTDLLGPTDAVSMALSAVRALADTLAPTDSETSLSGLSRADTAPLTDSLSTAKGAVLTASDNANLTDSVSIDLARSLSYATTDALGLTDSVTTVFTPGGPFNPGHLAGLVSWLDAADYSTGSWPNRGAGAAVTIPGTPAPTISANTLNGLPLVRFKYNEGKVRSTWDTNPVEWTLVYLVRWVGPGVGRAFSVQYPPSNLLVGMHTSQPDTMYNNGTWLTAGTGWNWWTTGTTNPWRMYGGDSTQSIGTRFFIDGVQVGVPVFNVGPQEGLYGGWALSGYGAGPEETIDIEVAELVLYDRKLADLDRQKIEDYLTQKWLSGQAHTLDYTDYTVPTDSFAGDKTSATTLSTIQNLPLSDTETAAVGIARADSLGLTDSVLVTLDRVYAKQDFTNPRDSVTTAANTVKALADLAGLSDIITVAWGRAHAQSDTLNETDSQTVSLLATRSDVADLSDTFLGTKTSAGEYATTELLGPVDSWTTVITRSLTADSAGLVDTVSVSKFVPVAKTDQITVTDSITLAVSRTYAKSDFTNPTDSITFTLSRAYAKTDSTNPTDSYDVLLLSQGVGWPSVFVSSAFVPKPGKNWIGNVWLPKPWKRWTGTEWKTIGTPVWDTATQAYLAATGLNESFAPALDGLVVGLKAKGLWSKMVAIYPFIGGTAALHKWNLKNPVDSDAAYRLTFIPGNGTGSHSAALGYRPASQGSVFWGSRADTHLVPRGIFDQDSTSLAYYSLADVPAISRCEMGCYNWEGNTANRFHIIACYTGSNFYYGMAEAGITGTPVPASSGLFVATRTAANYQAGYRNGALVGESAQPSIWLPPVPIWIGAINEFQDTSDLPCGFASIGSGLSAQDNADLYTVVQTYQTALGRQTP